MQKIVEKMKWHVLLCAVWIKTKLIKNKVKIYAQLCMVQIQNYISEGDGVCVLGSNKSWSTYNVKVSYGCTGNRTPQTERVSEYGTMSVTIGAYVLSVYGEVQCSI